MNSEVADVVLGEEYEDLEDVLVRMPVSEVYKDPSDALVRLPTPDMIPLSDSEQNHVEVSALKSENSILVAELRQLRLENECLTKELSNCTAVYQKLQTAFGASEAANQQMKETNAALERQVQELKGLLQSYWSTGVGLLISQVREEGAKFMHEGQNGYDDGQPPMNLEAAKGLLVALQEFPIYMTYCNKELRYVWISRTIKGTRPVDFIGKRDDEALPMENEGVKEFFDMKVQALEKLQTQIGELTIDYPLIGRMSWMVTCKPHLSDSGEVLGVSTASIDITEKVEVSKRLSKMHAQMVEGKATEGELRRTVQLTEEAIRAKNMFLAIMSHEIRTPLNGLLGMSEALAASDLTPDQRELVNAMLSSGVIIADILGDILDLASVESGAMELEETPFSPAEVVQDILKMALAATREKGITVQAEVDNNVPKKVVSDKLRIRQIMKYLVLNAIKFTQKGGVWIHLGVEGLDASSGQTSSKEAETNNLGDESQSILSGMLEAVDGQESFEPEQRNDVSNPGMGKGKDSPRGADSEKSSNLSVQTLLWCEIKDTGVGIPQESFATLFDTFTQVDQSSTRNFGGTGLGLAICKQLVELMGGQLTVTSMVGKGSTFRFTVLCKVIQEGHSSFKESSAVLRMDPEDAMPPNDSPLTSSSPQTTPDEQICKPLVRNPSLKPPRILLAEDNKVNVMVAISMLKRLGLTTQVVANGIEALKAIQREKYDLVLLDICMPLMDGLQVALAIRYYEETGEWPKCDLRNFFENASPSMLDKKSETPQGGMMAVQASREKKLATALEGLTRKTLDGTRRLPIVAVTANALRSDVEQYYAHGMDAFIAKPVIFQNLRETLAKYLPIPPSQPAASSHTSHKAPPVVDSTESKETDAD